MVRHDETMHGNVFRNVQRQRVQGDAMQSKKRQEKEWCGKSRRIHAIERSAGQDGGGVNRAIRKGIDRGRWCMRNKREWRGEIETTRNSDKMVRVDGW